MAAWADAEQRHADRSALPFAAAHAVEMGAWMLPALTRNPAEEPQPDNNKVCVCEGEGEGWGGDLEGPWGGFDAGMRGVWLLSCDVWT